MNGVDKITLREATKENYYALLLAVFLGMESATKALVLMGLVASEIQILIKQTKFNKIK